MKIIDNKKDYYDYLMGIYGQDEKIIFDRRGSQTYEYFIKGIGPSADMLFKQSARTIRLKIGDWLYTFERNEDTGWKWTLPKEVVCYRRWGRRTTPNPEPVKKKGDIPVIFQVEMLRVDQFAYKNETCVYTCENPLLKTFGMIPKLLDPVEVWNKLYDFHSTRMEKPIIDTRTDVQHLEAAGFDKKTSFRNVK